MAQTTTAAAAGAGARRAGVGAVRTVHAVQRLATASGATIGSEPTETRPTPARLEPIEPAVSSHATADDGTEIYYEMFEPPVDDAESRPARTPVLLVMGLGANGRLWAPAARRCLAAGYQVITFDNRGCGRSGTPWLPWTTQTMASDGVAVLDELGIREAHVGGASLGGMVAQELALAFPERVRTLVLAATTGGFRALDLAAPKGLLRVLEAAVRSRQAGDDPEQGVTAFLRMAASPEYAAQCRPGEETWESVAAMLEDPASERGVALQLLAALRHSTWSRLSQLTMPVLVHHGSADGLIPVAAGREVARRIPGARLEIYPGAGHGIFEYTEEVAENILGFFAASEANAAA